MERAKRIETARNALIGQAVGDAFGVPVEFLSRERVRAIGLREMTGVDSVQPIASSEWNTVRERRAIMTPRMMMNRYMHSTISPNRMPNSCRMTEKMKSL